MNKMVPLFPNFKFKKAAIFTDIHFGKKSNSEQHNQDCLEYINWFCDHVRQDPEIDHIIFMGDWHENRNALHISTLSYSFNSAEQLNKLGIPVFVIIGNHDLYYRHTRELHSLLHLSSLNNFHLIEELTIINTSVSSVLLVPYLFHHEYSSLTNYTDIPIWFGHFEFQGFIITGYNTTMPSGPNSTDYSKVKRIFSGHFHKRQQKDNVTFIGNAFPMDFGDVYDRNRGLATYQYESDSLIFVNWNDCPRYEKINLSVLRKTTPDFTHKTRVLCVADIVLTYEEINTIRQSYIDQYKLREMIIEDSVEISNILCNTEPDIGEQENPNIDVSLINVQDMMIQLLGNIDTEHLDNEILIRIYKDLKTENEQ